MGLYIDFKSKGVNRLTRARAVPAPKNFTGLGMGALSIRQEKDPPFAYGLGLREAD